MYSASLGRFLQSDPTGFRAGDVDLYRAEINNPVNRLDPSGLEAGPNLPPLQIRSDHTVSGYNFDGTDIDAGEYFDKINEYLEQVAAANRPLQYGEVLTLLKILNIKLEQGVGVGMDATVRQAFRRLARNAGQLLCRTDTTTAILAYLATLPDKKTAGEIGELIKQLGDRSFTQRESASKRLKEILLSGVPGVERAIREGLASDSPEVRLRTKRILEAGQASGSSIVPIK